MQNSPWKKERLYGLLFLVLAVTSALLSGYWSWSFLLWAVIYIVWKWLELYYFYKWYINTADNENIPLISGVLEHLSSLVLMIRNKNTKILNKNKILIKQFESTAQALPYATLLLDAQFKIKWVNRAAAQILGVMQNRDENNRVDNIIRDPKFVELLKSKEKTINLEMQHPLDRSKKVHLKLIRLSSDRYLLVARDISEQESLRNSRKAFVDNASHELRTPLTVIVGYLEMLHNSGEISQKWQTAIEQAMQQSARMESIINDMLKLSSIEHERYLEDNDDDINMPALLNRLLNDVKNSSKAKHHIFKANIDSSLNIKGNKEEIISIGLNLLNNAVIHTRENTEISLKWFRLNNKAYLWICDSGEGIEQKHLAHLTERFYRIDNSRDKNTNSTGLGLAIVKQICDNHNAALVVESEIGKGTCFKVVFPAVRIV